MSPRNTDIRPQVGDRIRFGLSDGTIHDYESGPPPMWGIVWDDGPYTKVNAAELGRYTHLVEVPEDEAPVEKITVVYVAGPFTGKNAWEVAQNVRRAEDMAFKVAEAGMMPLCPHTNTQNFHGTLTDEFWYRGTEELLRRCDAMVLVYPDADVDSGGTQNEVAICDELTIPFFRKLEKLIEWHEARQKAVTKVGD